MHTQPVLWSLLWRRAGAAARYRRLTRSPGKVSRSALLAGMTVGVAIGAVAVSALGIQSLRTNAAPGETPLRVSQTFADLASGDRPAPPAASLARTISIADAPPIANSAAVATAAVLQPQAAEYRCGEFNYSFLHPVCSTNHAKSAAARIHLKQRAKRSNRIATVILARPDEPASPAATSSQQKPAKETAQSPNRPAKPAVRLAARGVKPSVGEKPATALGFAAEQRRQDRRFVSNDFFNWGSGSGWPRQGQSNAGGFGPIH